jgi:hypothetical protein
MNVAGPGSVIFGVRVVSDLRKRKSSAFCGPLQAMRPTTIGMRRAIRGPWLCELVEPCSSVVSSFTPEMPALVKASE